jgi:hypothetical protein
MAYLTDLTHDERRLEVRVSFLPARRPQVYFGSGVYPVLDASPHGFRIRHADPVRPAFGADITGSMVFVTDHPPVSFEGVITRVQAADVAVCCTRVIIPSEWLLQEATYHR